jgi:intracellular sulfur oxidation DsrE/DsrF family protein
VSKGVEFRVCNNTLVSRKIAKEQVIMEAKIVPSGVAEVSNLQAKERYAYLKP